MRVIQRADELSEFVAIYWADGRTPLSAQVKKGLAAAFTRFDEYALAKYDRAGAVRLRDVLFLCHAKPRDAAQAELWKRLIAGELATPDTWEVALSSGGDKRTHWERLLVERTLGALALLRNLRNMKDAGVQRGTTSSPRSTRCGPTVFFPSASSLRRVTLRSGRGTRARDVSFARRRPEQLAGHTVMLVDVSGSMVAPLSRSFDDAAHRRGLRTRRAAARDRREGNASTPSRTPQSASRPGVDSLCAMRWSRASAHSGTYLGAALDAVDEPYDRIIVITDEQSHDRVGAPRGKGYMINVATARNGVGYGPWMHIDGFSEAVINYIRELENVESR